MVAGRDSASPTNSEAEPAGEVAEDEDEVAREEAEGQQAGGARQQLVMAGAGGKVAMVQGGPPGGTMSSVSEGGIGDGEEVEHHEPQVVKGNGGEEGELEDLVKTEDMLEFLEDLEREKEAVGGPAAQDSSSEQRWGDGYPPFPPGGCMAQICIGDLNPRLFMTAGSRMSLACLPTGRQDRNPLMILSTTDVGFNITALAPAKDSVAIMGKRRAIVKEYSKYGVEDEMEVGVESVDELKLCEWIGRHKLAVLAAGTFSVFARPYTEPVYKLGNGDIVDFTFDSKTERLFLLNSSGELRSPGSHSSLIKVIDTNIDTCTIRASNGHLYFIDTKGTAWSARIDTSGAGYDLTELDVESTKQVSSTFFSPPHSDRRPAEGALELQRAEGRPGEAVVEVELGDHWAGLLAKLAEPERDVAEVLGVLAATLTLRPAEEPARLVGSVKAELASCLRCRRLQAELGRELCPRCNAVVDES
jgi:hypothetical protein